MEVLDAHQHLGIFPDFHRRGAAQQAGESQEDRDFRTRVEAMDFMGVTRGIIGPAYQYLMPNGAADTRNLNNQIAAYRDRDRKRFPFAIAAIEPRQGDAALEEVRRVKRELGMVGFMAHNRLQGCYVDSPWMRKCVAVAAEEGLTPFIHSHHGDLLETPWRIERLLVDFPKTTFIVLDGLAGYEEEQLFYDIAKRRDNVVFDTGMWAGGAGKIDAAVDTLGVHRVIFGSGIYSFSQAGSARHIPDAVRQSRLSEKDKAQVFALNLYKILGKEPPK